MTRNLFSDAIEQMGGNEFKGMYVTARAIYEQCAEDNKSNPSPVIPELLDNCRVLVQTENELLEQFKNHITKLSNCPKPILDMFCSHRYTSALTDRAQKQVIIDIAMKSNW